MPEPKEVAKLKPNLPLKVEAFWTPAEARLELRLELLPTSELSHHQLAAMFNGKVDCSVDMNDDRGILKVHVTMEHDADVAAIGKAEHDLVLEARNRVPQ